MIRSKIAISTEKYYSCEVSKKLPVRISVLAVNGPEGLGFVEALDKKKETLDEFIKLMKKSRLSWVGEEAIFIYFNRVIFLSPPTSRVKMEVFTPWRVER